MSKISDLWVTVFQNGDRDPIRAALSRRGYRPRAKDTEHVPGFSSGYRMKQGEDGTHSRIDAEFYDQQYCYECGAWVFPEHRVKHLEMHDDIKNTKLMVDGIWDELRRDKEIMREFLEKEKE